MNRITDPPSGAAAGPSLEVTVDARGPHVEVRVSGELDLASARPLEEALLPYLGTGKLVVYDLDGVSFIDVAGIRPIKRQCETGVSRLRSGSPALRRLLGYVEEATSTTTAAWWLDGGQSHTSAPD